MQWRSHGLWIGGGGGKKRKIAKWERQAGKLPYTPSLTVYRLECLTIMKIECAVIIFIGLPVVQCCCYSYAQNVHHNMEY